MNKLGEKGITLVALVVTIILLLILAGVTIKATIGQNGLIKKVQKVANIYKEAENNEIANLNQLGEYLNNIKKIVIEYDLNGGKGQIKSQTKTEGQDLTITEEEPTRDGYIFLGWAESKEKANKGQYDYTKGDTYTEDKSIILYAVWQLDRTNIEVGCTVNYVPDNYIDNDTNPNDGGYTLLGIQSGYGSYSSSSRADLVTPKNQTIKQENFVWKVLSINENGTIDIMGVPTASHKVLELCGSIGYNNGVYLLNDLCNKLYSNSSLGAIARSINLKDIEKGMSDSGRTANEPDKIEGKYNANSTYYPALYSYEEGLKIEGVIKENIIDESDDGTNLPEIDIPMNKDGNVIKDQGYIKSTKNVYFARTLKNIKQNKAYYKDEKFYNLVFGTGVWYWLATRGVRMDQINGTAKFCMRQVDSDSLYGGNLFYSSGTYPDDRTIGEIFHICPIVTLDRETKLIKDANGNFNIEKE